MTTRPLWAYCCRGAALLSRACCSASTFGAVCRFCHALISHSHFRLYILCYTVLKVTHTYVYKLPQLEDKWQLMGYPMTLLTFSAVPSQPSLSRLHLHPAHTLWQVFYLNNTWSRFLQLYDHWNVRESWH